MKQERQNAPHRSRVSLAQNVRWGIRWGAILASVFSIYVLLRFLTGGLSAVRLGLVAIIVTYAISGVLGGAAVGAMRPILHLRSGAILAATVAAIPLGVMVRLAKDGLSPWTWGDTGWILTGAVLLGLIYGVVLHSQLKD